jgi:hypothetical protein
MFNPSHANTTSSFSAWRLKQTRINELCPEEGEQAVDIAGDGYQSPLRNGGPWGRSQSQECREAVDQDTQTSRSQAIFYTNQYVVCEGVVPAAQREPLPKARQHTIRALQPHLAAAGVISGPLCAAIFQETLPSYRRYQGVHDIGIPTYRIAS